MITKLCCKCKKELEIHFFSKNKNKKDGIQGCCKNCQKIYKDTYYNENKIKYKQDVKNRKDKAKKQAQDYVNSVKNIGCKHCKENHPACLDFHHLESSDKFKTISALVADGYNLKIIKNEIEKCIVLCANCHRKLHYNERL